MPDASTQTTKGKKIKLIKKPVSVKKLVKVWFDNCDAGWVQWNMCLDMCEEEFGISINAESNSDISDYLYTLYKENQRSHANDEEEEEEAWKKYREDDGEEPMVCGNVVDGVAIIGCGGVCYRSQQPETWSYGYWSYCKDCQEEE